MREFDLLSQIIDDWTGPEDSVLIPPGDDLAMIRMGGARLLVGVDQVVDGRHVDIARVPMDLVGRKAITRSLSDVAAMSARPVAVLVAATLPPDLGGDRARLLVDAMRSTALAHRCPLIGGDLAFHDEAASPLTCSVTVLAEPADHPPVTRAGAQPGDRVYVTGVLGGSIQPDALGHHLTFEPRIDEALALAASLGPRLHALIDLSDGLGRDASHIAARSGVQIRLDAAAIPARDGLDWRRALGDGEDYELCWTASGDVPQTLEGLPVTMVGRVCAEPGHGEPRVVVEEGGRVIDVTEMGWQHQT